MCRVVAGALGISIGRLGESDRLSAVGLDESGPQEGEGGVEDASRVGDVAVEITERRGGCDRPEMRRTLRGGVQLGDPAEADTDHPDAPVRPGLCRRPLDRVVAVLPHRLVEGVEGALRAARAAHLEAHDRIAPRKQPVLVDAHTVVEGVRAGAVPLVVDEDWVGGALRRVHDVVSQQRAVTRRHEAALFDGRRRRRVSSERHRQRHQYEHCRQRAAASTSRSRECHARFSSLRARLECLLGTFSAPATKAPPQVGLEPRKSALSRSTKDPPGSLST